MPAMRRSADERGAMAVIVALFMSVLLVAVGLSLDVGNGYVTRTKMQTAADSAALAVARDCALRRPACTAGADGTAAELVTANLPGTSSTATLNVSGAKVTVVATREVATPLLGAIGNGRKRVSTRATATWNNVPVKGFPILPLAVGWCDYQSRQPGSGASPALFRSDLGLFDRAYRSCPSATGTGSWNSHEGSLWLTNLLGIGGCRYELSIFSRLNAVLTTLLGAPLFCDGTISNLRPGATYWVPLYRSITWLPAIRDLTVEIVGFVPVTFDSWRFTYVTGALGLLERRHAPGGVPNCSRGFLGLGPCNGFSGTFQRTAQRSPDFEYGPGTDLGATAPILTGE